jgi:hypothetical protein
VAVDPAGLLAGLVHTGGDPAQHHQPVPPATDDRARPILLAVSDHGPQMTSGSTRE